MGKKKENKKNKETEILQEKQEIVHQKNKEKKKETEKSKAAILVSVDDKSTVNIRDKKSTKKAIEYMEKEEEVESMTDDDDISMEKLYENSLAIVKKNLNLNSDLIVKAIQSLILINDKNFKDSIDIFARKEKVPLQVNFTLSSLPNRFSPRPVSIPVTLTKELRKVCLIIKDNFVNIWKKTNIKFDGCEVYAISYSDLKLEYSQFEQKRNLAKRFDNFICDKSLYMGLKKVLGRTFYEMKKYPFAINLSSENNEKIDENEIKSKIENIVNNVVFYMSKGPNYTVKVDYLYSDDKKLSEKVRNTIIYVLAHILKWGVSYESVKSITLKTNDSVELPIFNQLTKEEVNAYYSKIEEKKDIKAISKNKISNNKINKESKEIKKEVDLKEKKLSNSKDDKEVKQKNNEKTKKILKN